MSAARLVFVSAVALVNGAGQVLLAERPAGKSLAGLWEFPGGKLEPGESPEDALSRELEEELGIVTLPQDYQPLTFASHSYEGFHLLMPLYLCRQWQGTPVPREGQKLAWVSHADLAAYPMPPADEPLLPALYAALSA